MSTPETPSLPNRGFPRALTFAATGIACYWVLYFAAPLPELQTAGGTPWRRIGLLVYLLLPEALAERWFGWPPSVALLDRVPIFWPAATILLAALAVGWAVLAALRLDRRLTRLETAVLAAAVGLNLLSTFVLAVGLCGLLRHSMVLLVPGLAFAGAAGWFVGRHGPALLSPATKPAERPPCTRTNLAKPTKARPLLSSRWLWALLPFAMVIVLGGMLPPLEFDVREYHLQAPKEFYQLGRIVFLPHNVYANMPLGSEMLGLLAMMLTGDWYIGALAGKTVIAATTPLTALALYAAGRRVQGVTAGVVASLCYLSIPWMVQVSNLGLVEGVVAFYWFLAVYAAVLATGVVPLGGEEPSAQGQKSLADASLSLTAVAGYLAGAAAACKYPPLLFLVLPLVAWTCLAAGGAVSTAHRPVGQGQDRPASDGGSVERIGRRRHSATRWLLPLVFLLAGTAGCGLWYAKNWAQAGNPTYPLLYSVFGGKSWDEKTDERWNRVHRPHDFSPGRLLHDAARVLLTSPWISPLVVPLAALAALAVCTPRRRRLVVALGLHALWVVAAWWLWTHRIDRFWLPVLPELALLAGVGAVWQQGKAWRGMLIGLLVAGLAWNLLVVVSVGGGYNRYFVPLARLRSDPERLDAWHRYFNAHGSGGRVLLVGEAQVFDLQVPILYNTCFNECIFERLVKGRTAEQVARAFAEQRISYVFVHWGEIARYNLPGNYGFTDFVEPRVFELLVAAGVLDPLVPIEGHPGRAYRVRLTPALGGGSGDI